jgi:hypothetical protein
LFHLLRWYWLQGPLEEQPSSAWDLCRHQYWVCWCQGCSSRLQGCGNCLWDWWIVRGLM